MKRLSTPCSASSWGVPTLSDRGSMSQSKLAELLDIRPQSLTSAMTKLEAAGLVKRERDRKDRRQILVSVTEEGKAYSKAHEAMRRRSAEELLAGLEEEEKETLYRLLGKALAGGKTEADPGAEAGKAKGVEK